jgi:hypothetical protein
MTHNLIFSKDFNELGWFSSLLWGSLTRIDDTLAKSKDMLSIHHKRAASNGSCLVLVGAFSKDLLFIYRDQCWFEFILDVIIWKHYLLQGSIGGGFWTLFVLDVVAGDPSLLCSLLLSYHGLMAVFNSAAVGCPFGSVQIFNLATGFHFNHTPESQMHADAPSIVSNHIKWLSCQWLTGAAYHHKAWIAFPCTASWLLPN